MDPYKTMLQTSENTDIILQELVTYQRKNGILVRTTVVRKFYEEDYIDTQTITPLA